MPSPEPTNPSLLSRVRDAQNDLAWREFDERYRGLILSFARRRGLQATDAEDVTQVVLAGLAKSLRNFQYRPELGRFRSYLGRCVRNAVQRHLGQGGGVRHLETPQLEALPAEDGDGEAVWEEEWVRHHYRRALSTLSSSFDESSVDSFRRLLDGQSVEQVAQTTGRTKDAVYKAKQRVRSRLQELVAKQVLEEEFPERQG